MAATTDQAIAYAALLLQDDELPVTSDKLQAILKAANVEVEPVYTQLFAKALGGVNIKELITSVSSGVGSGPAPAAAAAAPAAAGGAAPAAEEKKKKEEPKEESDDDMGFGLFD